MHKPARKKIIVVCSLFVLLILGCIAGKFAISGLMSRNTKYSGPMEKITVGNIGEFSIFNLIAKERGYFDKNGLDVEIKEFSSGPAAAVDLLAGKLDLTVAAEFVGVSNIFKDQRLRIISQVSEQEAFEIVSRKSLGVSVPSDLMGKRIGVTRRGAGEFFLGQFLVLNKMKLEDVELVDLPPDQMKTRLLAGDLDAISIFNPHAYRIKKQLGEDAVAWSAQGNQKTFAVLYALNDFIQGHSKLIERYLAALTEAEEYARKNPQETREFVAKKLGYDIEYLEYIWPKFDFRLALEQELLLTMEDQARFAIKNSLTQETKVPNYLNYIYFDALERVKSQDMNIVR